MNTSTIAAVLPNSPVPVPSRTGATPSNEKPGNSPSTTPAAARSGVESSNGDPGAASFSQVLSHQHAVQGQQPKNTASTAGQANAKTDNRHDAKLHDTTAQDDETLATLAGEQGLSLPQIALELAAHALPGTAKTIAAEGLNAAVKEEAVQPEASKARTTLAALAAQTMTDVVQSKQDLAAAKANGTLATKTDSPNAPHTPLAALIDAKLTKAGTTPDSKSMDTTVDNVRAPAQGTAQTARGAHAPASTQAMAAAQAAVMAATQQHGTTTQQHNAGTLADSSVGITPAIDIAGLTAAGSAQAQNAGMAASTAGPAISTPLQQSQWPADFGRQVVTLAQTAHNQPQTAELRLDPPDLGPLRITISINDNVAHAVFVSAHASVRHAVENALPQLQQQLAQAGISLGQSSVNDQGQQQTPFEQTFQSSGKQPAVMAASTGEPIMESSVARASARAIQNPNALVDTFA